MDADTVGSLIVPHAGGKAFQMSRLSHRHTSGLSPLCFQPVRYAKLGTSAAVGIWFGFFWLEVTPRQSAVREAAGYRCLV